MNAAWKKLASRFAALQQREKALVAVAMLAGVVLGGYALWVDPATVRAAALKLQIEQQKGDLAALQAQVGTLKAQLRDPDAANKGALAETRARLAATDRQLQELGDHLVPPDRVPALLQSLLARHRGLSLLSLKTLAPQPLIEPAAEKKDAKPGEAKKPEPPPAVPGSNIYKHGLEIRIAGSYADLLAYVGELERAPQRLLWERMALAVTAYPRTELTLTVYTLSLDADWLVV